MNAGKAEVLVLGDKGMLGHMVKKYFETMSDKYLVWGLNREDGFDARTLSLPVYPREYDYIINCVGILNTSDDIQLYADVNVVFPKALAIQCCVGKTKLIHISTNCVFAGIGPHVPYDIPDATDLYGRSKAMGEIMDETNLTIRCSIIGTELKEEGTGLINQFLTNDNFDTGFRNIFWNGITTLQLAKWIERNLELTGLQHYYTKNATDKFNLLKFIRDTWKVDKELKVGYRDMHQSLLTGEYYTETPIYKQLQELKDFNESSNDSRHQTRTD